MKTYPWGLDVLLATGKYVHADLYDFTLQDGTHLRYTTADSDVFWGSPNYATHPYDFSNASWLKYKTAVDADFATAPDGTTTADRIRATVAIVNDTYDIAQITNPTLGLATFTSSVYAKQGTTRYVVLIFGSNTSGTIWINAVFDLQLGTVTQTGAGSSGGTLSSANIEAAGSGWYRIILTGSLPATNTFIELDFSTSGTPSIGGFGEPIITADGTQNILLWGWEFVTGDTVGKLFTSKGPFFEDISSPSRGHWKAGLDLDTWKVTIAPAVADPVTGASYPATIYGQPWLVAARVGALDGATVDIHRAYWGDGVRQQCTTLDPASIDTSAMQLLDYNRTVFSLTGAAGDQGVRSVASFSSGKYYCELKTQLEFGSNRQAVGIGTSSAVTNGAFTSSSYLGGLGNDGIGLWDPGSVYLNNVAIATIDSYVTFHVNIVSLAIDADNKTIWWRVNGGDWNASATADPAANIGGFDFSAITGPYYVWINIESTAGDLYGMNFGAVPYVYAAPSGFNNLLDTELTDLPTAQWPREPRPSAYDPTSVQPYPGNKSSLSSDNLTFTTATVNKSYGARSAGSFAAGKFYVEFYMALLEDTTERQGVGVGNFTAVTDDVLLSSSFLGGLGNDGIGYWNNTGKVYLNDVAIATLDNFVTGSTVSMAVDADNRTIWFRVDGGNWNASASANPATNTGGISWSAVTPSPFYVWNDLETSITTAIITTNFGATAYKYTPPFGFNNLLAPPTQSPYAPDFVLTDLFAGRVAEVDVSRTKAVININSFVELLQRPMPRNLYQASCRHTLFDAGCALTRASFAVSGTVSSVTDDGNFLTNLTNTNGYFTLGMLTWTTGDNTPFSRSVRQYVYPTGQIVLISPMPYAIQVGDAFTVYPGCDKTQATCQNTFSNLANFGGFPFVPTPESAI